MDIHVSQSGLYLLEGFTLSPFKPVPARTVLVQEGQTTSVIYELTRAE